MNLSNETVVVKVCGVLLITYFVFDSYRKCTMADDLEGDRIKFKFH